MTIKNFNVAISVVEADKIGSAVSPLGVQKTVAVVGACEGRVRAM